MTALPEIRKAAIRAMEQSEAWPVVFRPGSAGKLADAALTVVMPMIEREAVERVTPDADRRRAHALVTIAGCVQMAINDNLGLYHVSIRGHAEQFERWVSLFRDMALECDPSIELPAIIVPKEATDG